MRGGERSIADDLRTRVRPAELCEALNDGALRCTACGHLCRIRPGGRGVCLVRYHDGRALQAPWGYVSGLAVDPIEKKPFFHALPGARTLSFGTLGCNFRCDFCQNAATSQTLRDPGAGGGIEDVEPEEVVRAAVARRAEIVASTYNEPLITSEWAGAILRPAASAGMLGAFVSNGHASLQVLAYLRPFVDLFKVDLKCFDPRRYAALGGRLGTVLRTIRALVRSGTWVEVVTLVVPGWNDSDAELGRTAAFLASVSPDLPWHVTAFHPDYRMTDRGRTPSASLRRAAEIGGAAGLRFVYAGNVRGLEDLEETRCPGCGETLVERAGFTVGDDRLRDGACPRCARAIPGVWRGRGGVVRVGVEKAPAQEAWERGDPAADSGLPPG